MPRQPYFFQVGFDFGTSFSKCVVRDVMKEKAWTFRPPNARNAHFSFLLPGGLLLTQGRLRVAESGAEQYHSQGLPHLKVALAGVAQTAGKDDSLEIYLAHSGPEQLQSFVKACGVYFLGYWLGAIRNEIRKRYVDFGHHRDDYVAVNLAIPVAHAERRDVNQTFQNVLNLAWENADDIFARGEGDLKALQDLVQNSSQSEREDCYVYPEVSANVQGFVRSRVSYPGLYLFVDTGAGTVDFSSFIFFRNRAGDQLTFLAADVTELGSAEIERRAARALGRMDLKTLDELRLAKERNKTLPALGNACQEIRIELRSKSERLLTLTKQKLYTNSQFHSIRLIFSGGGHAQFPYELGVRDAFDHPILRSAGQPDSIGMPFPVDLEGVSSVSKELKRLYVAYGLAFPAADLAAFRYPSEIKYAIRTTTRCHIEEVSKDVC